MYHVVKTYYNKKWWLKINKQIIINEINKYSREYVHGNTRLKVWYDSIFITDM